MTRTEVLESGQPVTRSQEDTDTKTIVLDGRHVLGFAGLARLPREGMDSVSGEAGRQRMESWLSEALNDVAPQDYWTTIAERFGPAAENAHHMKPHKFVSIGWAESALGYVHNEIIEIRNSAAAVHTFYAYRRLLTEPFELSTSAKRHPRPRTQLCAISSSGT